MNLLEHYIIEIIREISLTDKGLNLIEVIVKVDCYGTSEVVKHLFTPEEWKQAKKDGYFLA